MRSILGLSGVRLRCAALLLVGPGLALAGCTSSEVGKACTKSSACGDGLVCDIHDGKGTCQEPHGHEGGEEAGDHEDTAHHDSEDTAHATDTAHAVTTGETGHEATDTSEETAHHDSEDTSHDPTSTM